MNWIRRFMIGRYGSDHLSIALMGVWIFMWILSRFVDNKIIGIFYMVIPVIIFYRIFSKDITKRYQENIKFLNIWNPIKNRTKTRIQQLKDFKHYRYFKCSNCKQILRVPKGKGKISITCPRCKNIMIKKS